MEELSSHNCFYRAVTDQMVDLVTVADLDGTIVFLTPSIERLLGRTAMDRVGKNLFEFVHPDDVSRVRAAFDEAVRSDEPAGPIEYRCRHRDGDWRLLESVAGRCVDTEGVMRILVQSRDATERRTRDGQSAHASALAEAASLSGSIARDFNNLLIVLARQVAMLESGRDATLRRNVQGMRDAIDRAGLLVTQLLAFAQVDEVPRAESCDVNRALEEMAADLERVSGPNVEVFYLLGATEPHARLSRAFIERLLVALVARARDAMPKGGRLTILTRNETVSSVKTSTGHNGKQSDQVVIELTDTAMLSEEARAHLFETVASSSGSEAHGLHAVQAIVQQAGGRIVAESALGGGTTIRVQLPRTSNP